MGGWKSTDRGQAGIQQEGREEYNKGGNGRVLTLGREKYNRGQEESYLTYLKGKRGEGGVQHGAGVGITGGQGHGSHLQSCVPEHNEKAKQKYIINKTKLLNQATTS